MLDLLSIVFLGAVAACLVFFALVAALGILMTTASRSFAMPPARQPRPLGEFTDDELLAAVRYEQGKAAARELDGGAVHLEVKQQGAQEPFQAANEAWKAPCKPCEALRRAGKAVARRMGIL